MHNEIKPLVATQIRRSKSISIYNAVLQKDTRISGTTKDFQLQEILIDLLSNLTAFLVDYEEA